MEYLEPALLMGERGSRASDLWSLGLTLHRGLTGVSAYPNLSSTDALLAVRTVLSSRPVLDASLDPRDAAVIARCLAPQATDRPATALELAEELEALSS